MWTLRKREGVRRRTVYGLATPATVPLPAAMACIMSMGFMAPMGFMGMLKDACCLCFISRSSWRRRSSFMTKCVTTILEPFTMRPCMASMARVASAGSRKQTNPGRVQGRVG